MRIFIYLLTFYLMAGNWIILDNGGNGRPINLDFVIDVQFGADWSGATTDQKKSIFVYQAVQTNAAASTKLLPQYAAVKFKSEALARAAGNRIIQTLNRLGYIQDDMRVPKVTLVATSMAAATAGVAGTIIQLTGTGFSNGGQITFADSTTGANSAEMPAGVLPDSGGTLCQFVLDTAIAAGTYDIEYTDSNGNAAVLASAIVVS